MNIYFFQKLFNLDQSKYFLKYFLFLYIFSAFLGYMLREQFFKNLFSNFCDYKSAHFFKDNNFLKQFVNENVNVQRIGSINRLDIKNVIHISVEKKSNPKCNIFRKMCLFMYIIIDFLFDFDFLGNSKSSIVFQIIITNFYFCG